MCWRECALGVRVGELRREPIESVEAQHSELVQICTALEVVQDAFMEVLLTVARSVSVCTPNVECGSACTLANMVASGGGRPLWAHGSPNVQTRVTT